MGLKAFHIFFIIVSIILAFGFGVWEINAYTHGGGTGDLVLAILSLGAGVGLIFYLKAVLRKLKDIGFL
jgi:hypothetical protein